MLSSPRKDWSAAVHGVAKSQTWQRDWTKTSPRISWKGEGRMFWENSIETCILLNVKQIASPGWMHETSARGWCTGMTQRDKMGRKVGGGSGWRTYVNPWLIHVNVWQKTLQYCKVISLQLIKIKGKKREKERQKNKSYLLFWLKKKLPTFSVLKSLILVSCSTWWKLPNLSVP